MYSGGIADKLGNQYEAKFLVLRLLDVLAAEADWIRFEGINNDYNGFEFALGQGRHSKWFQTKINASHGNWTINALKAQGVLSAFARRLDSDENSACYFISQNSANDLRLLSDKARISNSIDEYQDSLTQDQAVLLTNLSEAWSADKNTTFSRLTRSYFEVHHQREIDALTSTKAKYTFSEWGDNTYSLLRGYMEGNLNKVITTEVIRQYLKTEHVGFKDWALAPTLKEKITKQTDRYLKTYTPFGVGGHKISRREVSEIVDELDNEAGAKVILLTGIAGSGKSGAVREIIDHLREKNVIHLAFRVDQHLDCKTPEKIGLELTDRNESPVITLHGLSQNNPAVLIVDQVDAISEVSGRKGAVKNAVLEFLEGLRALKTKIVLVCRDFDLDNDSRLKELEGKEKTKRIKLGLLNWDEEIIPVMEKSGVDPKRFTDGQKCLLSLPLNLSLYFEVGDYGLEFDNREDLFNALLKKKELELQERNVSWSILTPLSSLATWMSENQKLSAPSYILDGFPKSLDILTSDGLIVQQDRTVNFFHESFFDYIYARTFLNLNQSITDILFSTEQHLFRRTQVRQILEVLRQFDRTRYLSELTNLYQAGDIRYHIKIAIAKWLGSLKDPTEQERQIGLSLDHSSEGFSNLARAVLLGSSGWFDVHERSGWLLEKLSGEDEQQSNDIFWWLLRISHEKPAGVADILRKWSAGNSERAVKLLKNSYVITTKGAGCEIEPLETLYLELIEAEPKGLFSDDTRQNRDMILNTWVNENSLRGSKFLKAYLNSWFKVHPGDHPFSRDHFSDLDIHSLSEASEKNPSQFLCGFLDALNKSVELIKEIKSAGEYDSTFEYIKEKECYGSDKLVQLLRAAFKSVGKTDSDTAKEYLNLLPPKKHRIFLHFHLETISENPEPFKDEFLSLLDYENLLEAGFTGAEWMSFSHAAKSMMPFLSCEEREKVWGIVAQHNPELDHAIRYAHENSPCSSETRRWIIHDLNNSKFTQWCIFKTIGSEYFNDEVKTLFNELSRKFVGREIATPRTSKGGFVRSPIALEHAKYMTDEQWLKAIDKYDSEQDREWHDDYVIGGSEQLANVLSECTKSDPARFSLLLEKIPLGAKSSYPRSILFGLQQSEDCGLGYIKSVIDFSCQYYGNLFAQEIMRLIAKYPGVCEEKKYWDLAIWNACNGTADDDVVTSRKEKEEKEISTIEDVARSIDSLHTSGINDVRGSSIWTLARVYWEFPKYSEEVDSFLKKIVVDEKLTSVRCVVVDLLLPYYNFDRDKCGMLLEHLVAGNPDKEKSNFILTSHSGIRILQYILGNVTKSGKNLLSILLGAQERETQLIGAWLAFGVSYNTDEYDEIYDRLVKKDIEHKRLAAQVASDCFSMVQFRDKAIAHTMQFFNDQDEHVRSNAKRVFRHMKPDDIDQYPELVLTYLSSKAFAGDTFDFLRLLKESRLDVSEYVVKAAERILFNEETSPKENDSYRNHHYLDELMEKEYSASEYNADLRKRYLDIIDRMLYLGIYGVEKIVETHDRSY